MKIKNPLLVYVLFWVTFGLYGIYWASQVMASINKQKNEKVYNQAKIGISVIVFFLWDIFLFNQIPKAGLWLFFLVFAQHVCWIAFVFYGMFHFSKNIQDIEMRIGETKVISPGKTLLFMALYFTGIPYIQSHLNRIEKINAGLAETPKKDYE